MARPGKLTDEQVLELRESYAHQRYLAENDDEYRETVVDTEERLAERFGVSAAMIRRTVLGLSYAHVGGPLDERRRAASKEAGVGAGNNATRIVVTRPGEMPKEFIHPPSTTVTVEGCVADLSQYTAGGTPVRSSTAGRAPAKPKRKHTSQMTQAEFKRHQADEAIRGHENGEVDSAAPSRGGVI